MDSDFTHVNGNKKDKKIEHFLQFLICAVFIFFIAKGIIWIAKNPNFTPTMFTANVSNLTIENLGIQFQALNSGPGVMFFDANGDPHWFVVYSNKVQFIDVNLKTGEKRYFNTGKSGLGSYSKALSGNKLFVFIGDTCSVWEYDITAGTIKELKQAGSNNGCGNSTGTQSSYTAPDGMVYAGTAHRSTVYEIDPATGNIRDFGIVDPPAGNPTCSGCASRQIANIVADTTYIYTLVRDTATNSYWLAILNRSDGSLSASCNKDDRIPSGKVATSVDGTQIWYNSYRVDNTNGQCPTTPGTPPALKTWFFPSNVYYSDGDAYAQAASVFGADIDASDVQVDSSTGGVATMLYRYPAGSGNWTQVTQQILMKDSQIKRILAKDDTSAYLISGTYGPNSIFNGSSNTMLGRIAGQSTYAAAAAGQYIYFSGYTATTYRYTPSQPWSITGSGTTCSVSSPSNPCLAFAGMGKYHYYLKVASNGNLYIASDYKRGSRGGGDIGWINPATGATNSYAITCDAPAGFALFSDGIHLAYSGSGEDGSFGCTNTVGKVFIFNTSTNTLARSFTPVAGSDSQGTIIETNDGGILGIIGGYPSSGQYTMYKVDVNGNHASWSPMVVTGSIFGATNGADKFLIKSRDGMVYTTGGTNEIIKINPNDGSRTLVSTTSAYVTAMEFVGDDLYMAVGSNESKLQRIRGLNPAAVTLSSTKAISSFDFSAISVTGVVNESAHTIALVVPFGTNVTALVPTITTTGASISPNTGVAQDFTNPVTYTVTAADASTQAYTVTVTVLSDTSKKTATTSASREIVAFNFNSLSPAVVGIINEVNRTISLSVPFGTNITSLFPNVVMNGVSISPNTGKLQDFTNPVTYTVTAADGSTQAYTVTVTVLPDAPKKVTINPNIPVDPAPVTKTTNISTIKNLITSGLKNTTNRGSVTQTIKPSTSTPDSGTTNTSQSKISPGMQNALGTLVNVSDDSTTQIAPKKWQWPEAFFTDPNTPEPGTEPYDSLDEQVSTQEVLHEFKPTVRKVFDRVVEAGANLILFLVEIPNKF